MRISTAILLSIVSSQALATGKWCSFPPPQYQSPLYEGPLVVEYLDDVGKACGLKGQPYACQFFDGPICRVFIRGDVGNPEGCLRHELVHCLGIKHGPDWPN